MVLAHSWEDHETMHVARHLPRWFAKRMLTAGRRSALASLLLLAGSLSLAADHLGQAPTGTIAGHPALARSPRHATTSTGHRGDAVNVAFIGSEADLHCMLALAGWYAADPITLKTSAKIAAAVVLKKPYDHAPISNLYLWGRVQDAAFEQPVGNSPSQRHHVRFWRSAEVDPQGRPLWLGAATFDQSVEISRTTGGFTHMIAPEIDKERDKLLLDTVAADTIDGYYWVERFQPEAPGKNGGGDPYRTDQRLAVGVIDLRE